MAGSRGRRHAHLGPALVLVLAALDSTDALVARATTPLHDKGCSQVAGAVHDARQEDPFTWALNISTVPAYLDPQRVARTVVRGTETVARAAAPCTGVPSADLPRVVPPGTTQRHANVTPDGHCFPDRTSDGISVVSFGDLPRGVVSVSCTYAEGGDIWQADVSEEPRTDDLTMSSFIGRCDPSARTLGRGDLLALARLYPASGLPAATAVRVSAATSETTATPPNR